ncbi:MAG: hypothetical protein ACK4P1_03145 [Aggregatilineales bacterium]
MSQTARQFIFLTAAIILITAGSMLLLLGALSGSAPNPTRPAPTILAAPSPTAPPEAQSEPPTPAENGAIALILGAISAALVALLSLSVLRTQRPSQER